MSFKFQGKTSTGEVVEWDMLEDSEVSCDIIEVRIRKVYPNGLTFNIPTNVLKDTIKPVDDKVERLREVLLQVQDHMSQLSSHTSDGWAGSSADEVYNMIEERLKEIMEDDN